MTLAAQVNFGLEELAGIDCGVKRKELYNEQSMIEKLMNAYYKKDESHLKLNYNEQNIADLVEYAGMQEYDGDDSKRCGIYVGELITNLTEKNEKHGKQTIIDIPENRLDWLGSECKKFDVVRIGVNYGDHVFEYANKGNLLYVEDCEGSWFAEGFGNDGGKVGAIVGIKVGGSWFAEFAGNLGGKIGAIVGVNVKGGWFAANAGNDGGKVGNVIGNNVSGNLFTQYASSYGGNIGNVVGVNVSGDGFADIGAGCNIGKIGKILVNSRNADIEYNRIVERLNNEYNLNLKKVKVRKERSAS
ncbi:MAG: hypothetical protein PHC66_04970 [Candidatus Nanoarchaeia archaeon]|nr:hypothetical protein [Candidatus Nanoarchaeia archaeon]MDD5238896.1 hypothetical protein [Candidatus Nanoarchaeia archaeon]